MIALFSVCPWSIWNSSLQKSFKDSILTYPHITIWGRSYLWIYSNLAQLDCISISLTNSPVYFGIITSAKNSNPIVTN